MPKVSIIIPLYNKAPYVTKALESVWAQTYRDYEVVIVNDGSTDNSVEVIRNVICNMENGVSEKFHLIEQENAGVSAARNKGIEECTGAYVAFLDADDWWAPEYLEEMMKLTEEYPDAGIYGSNYWYVKNGRQRIVVKNCDTGYINYFRKYAENIEMVLWTGAVMLPRNVLADVKWKMDNGIEWYFNPQLKLGEDFELWVRIAKEYKMAFLNKPLSYYNQDVDVTYRGIGKLRNPNEHMLFNTPILDELEDNNTDYKYLIDTLRVSGLQKYWLSPTYHDVAKSILTKVQWRHDLQPYKKWYSTPLWILRIHHSVNKMGSLVKQKFLKLRYAK